MRGTGKAAREDSVRCTREAELAEGAPRNARLAVALLFLVNGILFATWVSRIPGIQAQHQLSHGALGLGLLGMATGALIAMPLGGWLALRFGSARVCSISAVLYAAALPLLALAPDVGMLMVVLFCFGSAHGMLDVAMNAQAVEVEDRLYSRPIMSSFHALFSVGGLIGSLAGGAIAAAGTQTLWHFTAVALGAVAVSVLVAVPKLLAPVPRPRGARETLVRNGDSRRPPKLLFILGLLAFCVMLGEGAMADWSGIYLRQVTGSTEAVAAAGYAAFSVAMAAGRFLGDYLAARFGGVFLVRSGGCLAVIGLATALFSAHPIVSICAFAIVGAGFSTVVPQVFTAAARVSGVAPGPALAVVSTTGYFGFLIGPPLIGFAAEFFGLHGALWMVAGTSALLAVLAGYVATPNRSPARAEQMPTGLTLEKTL